MWLVVAGGGALGCLSRYGLTEWFYHVDGKTFPWGILTANVLGSLLIGMVAVVLLAKNPSELWRGAIIIGFLGGFTTFSSFSLDTVRMLQEGLYGRALTYILASVVLCLLATAIGWWLGSFCK